MSARLIERVKAFEALAPHLTAERRVEIAERLAAELAPTRTTRPTTPAGELALHGLEPDPDPTIADPVVAYLHSIGFREGELVRAAGRLASAVRRHRAASGEGMPVTDELLAFLWNEITAAADA